MKKFLIFLLVGAMAASAVACSSAPGTASGTPPRVMYRPVRKRRLNGAILQEPPIRIWLR